MNFKQIITAITIFNLTIPASIASGSVIRSPDILRWETYTAEKGFILSNYLYNEQGCSAIWEKQLPEFQKRNLHVEDPDVIEKGTVITVQLCQEKNQSIQLSNGNGQNPAPQNSGDEKISTEESINSPYIHLFGGFLTENEKYEQIDGAYGIGVTGDLFRFLGYNIRLLGSQGVMFMQNEVRFKTSPDYKTRGHLILGMGNRLGLQNKDLDRLNKGVDSFNYVGFGLEMNPHSRYRFGLDLTGNLGAKFAPNFGAYAQKRLGEDYWLGVYAEFNSSRSSVDDNEEDRRFFTGGLKFSF
jgi:hypothetical protein